MSGDVHVRICERLGVRFPRATRRNIYVGSERAGQRVMDSITRFIDPSLDSILRGQNGLSAQDDIVRE